MDAIEINPDEIRDLGDEALDEAGRLRILPASFWAATSVQERALFGHRNGLYLFPTVELVDRLRQMIGGRSAIEIGAGNGVLAQALGIPATDNKQQEMPKYRAAYELSKQPIVRYGDNIVEMNASRAVRQYKPQVVLGSWITHKYDPARHVEGGNEIGVDQRDVLLHCEQYIVVGNEHTHRFNPLWSRPHEIDYPPYVFSRASNGRREFICTWAGAKRHAKQRP